MPLSIPTTSALPPSQLLLSTHPSVHKTLSRLSRASLLTLALDWLDEKNQELTAPYLHPQSSPRSASPSPDPDDAYPPSTTLSELRDTYAEMQSSKGSKRDVLDRMLEGDWRHGVSLYQLAMADMQCLYDRPGRERWSALKIVPVRAEDESSTASRGSKARGGKIESVPRFHPSTFLRNLQREVLPDVKAHYNLDRHADLPLWILRVWIVDSPYDTSLALTASSTKGGSSGNTLSFDGSRTFYIAFPDAAPYIYVSLTTAVSAAGKSEGAGATSRSLRKLTLEGVPKAFSRPRERYGLEKTELSARNLAALCERRGGGRGNAAGGGWGVYIGEGGEERDNPLGVEGRGLLTPESIVDDREKENKDGKGGKERGQRGMKRKRDEDPAVVKRRRGLAQGRFGNSAQRDDGKGIERLDIRLEDPFPDVNLFAEIDLPNGQATRKKRRGRRSAVDAELDNAESGDEDAEGWRPNVRVTFQGPHVFAGIRELVEAGLVDGERMPGWMTGEEGVSIGVVREGRVKGWKGSGV